MFNLANLNGSIPQAAGTPTAQAIAGAAQQQAPQQGIMSGSFNAPQGAGILNKPIVPHNQTYNNMLTGNGGAPTQDITAGLNIQGRPMYLMNQHQDQAVNNRRSDIEGFYNKYLGRGSDAQGIVNWLNAGFGLDKIKMGFENSHEFQNKAATEAYNAAIANPDANFNAQYYLQQNPDVAANSRYGNDPLGHYRDYGKSEGRAAFDPLALKQQMSSQHYSLPEDPAPAAVDYTPDNQLKYQSALVNRLRGGTFKNANQVWGDVAGGIKQAETNKSVSELEARLKALEESNNNSNSYNYYYG